MHLYLQLVYKMEDSLPQIMFKAQLTDMLSLGFFSDASFSPLSIATLGNCPCGLEQNPACLKVLTLEWNWVFKFHPLHPRNILYEAKIIKKQK